MHTIAEVVKGVTRDIISEFYQHWNALTYGYVPRNKKRIVLVAGKKRRRN
jgi:hypothetical protein